MRIGKQGGFRWPIASSESSPYDLPDYGQVPSSEFRVPSFILLHHRLKLAARNPNVQHPRNRIKNGMAINRNVIQGGNQFRVRFDFRGKPESLTTSSDGPLTFGSITW